MNYQVVYILGSGHSGSTLLDLLLGAHPQIWSCGELQSLWRYVASESRSCACGAPVSQCSFWNEVLLRLRRKNILLTKSDFTCPSWRRIVLLGRRKRDSLAKAYGDVNRELFDGIAAASRKPLIVDSSKQAQRLFFLGRSKSIDLKVIHLMRDGRAVMNSFLRKYGTSHWWRGMYRWMSPNVMALMLRRQFGAERWLNVSYEALATEPEPTLQRICYFLNVVYDPTMLHFKNRIAHNIGGNTRVLTSSLSTVQMDERWKRELKLSYRLIFGLVGGWLNRILQHGHNSPRMK